MNQNSSSLNYLNFFLSVILILGIFFRFININQKVYWGDEVLTAIRTSGYTTAEASQEVFNNRIIEVESLQKYLSFNSEKNFKDILKALASHPEHPPLYYLSASLLRQYFGNSMTVARILSALISLLAFPSIYWLCLELFNSSLVGWIAVALIAVSPLHILYAQEARQYSLWTVMVLLSSATLLRAIRLKTKRSWGLYGIALIGGLYSHLLFVLVALGHSIYVIVNESFRVSKTVILYCWTTFVGILAFTPWMAIILVHPYPVKNTVSSTGEPTSITHLLERLFRHINLVFFNADLGYANVILFLLSLYSLYFICKNTPKRVWLFILVLIGFSGLIPIIPDLISGKVRSFQIRHIIPFYVGIQLAFAYLLAAKFTSANWTQKLMRLLLITVLAGGIIGDAFIAKTEVAWSKGGAAQYYHQIAQAINQAPHPLIISDTSLSNILALSYQLNSQVKLQLLSKINRLKIPEGFDNVFLFAPSDKLRKTTGSQPSIQLKPIIKEKNFLWKIINLQQIQNNYNYDDKESLLNWLSDSGVPSLGVIPNPTDGEGTSFSEKR